MTNLEFSSGGVVIKKDGADIKVLLIKDGYGHWTWPKGNIDKGETSKDAAIREIGEEAGLKKIELLTKIDKVQYFYKREGKTIFKTVYIYLFRLIGEERLKPLKSEIEDAAWFTTEASLKKIEYEGAKEVLKKAIDRFKVLNK